MVDASEKVFKGCILKCWDRSKGLIARDLYLSFRSGVSFCMQSITLEDPPSKEPILAAEHHVCSAALLLLSLSR